MGAVVYISMDLRPAEKKTYILTGIYLSLPMIAIHLPMILPDMPFLMQSSDGNSVSR